MRVTQRMLQRSYVNRMNKNMENLARSNERMSSQQKYNRMWENTAEVARAFQVREQLYRNEQSVTNIQTAQSEVTAAESSMQMLNNMLRNVEDRLIQANTGTISSSERELIAREMESIQEQVLQVYNTKFSDKYLFAASGTGKAPFENQNGKLMFNGYPVDELVTDPATGRPAIMDPITNTLKPLDYNKDVYIDIGMGMVVDGEGENAQLDKKSAFRLSTSGLDAFGYGVDANGMPNNILSLIQNITTAVKNSDTAGMDKGLTAIKGAYDRLLMSITDVGVRSSYLDESWNRMDDESIQLKTLQQKLEGAPLEEESIYNKSYEMSWMVTLQLGSKIIPPSIFDFLR